MPIKQYLFVKKQQELKIKLAQQLIEDEYINAIEYAYPPTNKRPATEKDVVVGNIIWYNHNDNKDSTWDYWDYWNIVDEVIGATDSIDFVYVAHDGCRYGLCDAYVDAEEY